MIRSGRPSYLGATFVAGLLVLTACSASSNTTTRTTHPRATTTTRTPASTTSESTTSTSSTTLPADQLLKWIDCDDGFQCAQLDVPIDYRVPTEGSITLALARRPATNPSKRIGSLVMNPGGPGGSAIDFIEGTPLPAELTEIFDIVGFDPRGVGRSSPLNCRTHLRAIYDADPTMEDDADRAAYLRVSKAFVDECAKKYKALLPFLGTVNVARDMDQVRAALGDDKLTYLGYSYGTSIGQQYARLFPTKVRAMVLDGVVDSSLTGVQGAALQAKGFTRALDNFVAECDRSACGLPGPAADVINEVRAAAEIAPIPARRADRPAGPGAVELALGQALRSETLWPELARALSQGASGNGNAIAQLADAYLERHPDGTYPNGFEIYFAVGCLDATWPKDPKVVFDAAKLVGALYPQFGEAAVNDFVRCALWPVTPQPLKPLDSTVKGLPPVVVISTTGDPATPYESGFKVADQIPTGVLVTNKGEGHTVFGSGKPCIDDAVTLYLVGLTPPMNGLVCS